MLLTLLPSSSVIRHFHHFLFFTVAGGRKPNAANKVRNKEIFSVKLVIRFWFFM